MRSAEDKRHSLLHRCVGAALLGAVLIAGVADAASPPASAALAAWRSAFRKAVAKIPRTSSADFAPALHRRIAIDQAARNSIPDTMLLALSPTDKAAGENLIWAAIERVDDGNVLFLKRHLPNDGWFRFSRDGKSVARDAWVIVDHSRDDALKSAVLDRMEALVPIGEASGEDYALLYDRVQVSQGRPQRFGSQITCINGKLAPGPIEDPENLDARRKRFGLKPFNDYFSWWAGKAC